MSDPAKLLEKLDSIAERWERSGNPVRLNPSTFKAARDTLREALDRLTEILNWADFALKNPAEFNGHGVQNLAGPAFDNARDFLAGKEVHDERT